MVGSREPRRRGDDGRRAELVRAASRVIAKDGIAAATTRRIAAEAGVPSGLVHYWFSGKDELLEAVVADALRPIENAASRPLPAAPDGQEGMLARLRAAFEAVTQDDRGRQIALYELTTWVMRHPQLRDVARRQYAEYRRAGIEATAAWMRDTGVAPSLATPALGQFISALFDGLVIAWLADPDTTDVDAVLRLVSDLVESRFLDEAGGREQSPRPRDDPPGDDPPRDDPPRDDPPRDDRPGR